MNKRERQGNPFLGLQATVFQRKRPLPPIKRTRQKPSKIPIPISRTTTYKYEKLPAIDKQYNNTSHNDIPITYHDPINMEAMATPRNIQTNGKSLKRTTDCFALKEHKQGIDYNGTKRLNHLDVLNEENSTLVFDDEHMKSYDTSVAKYTKQQNTNRNRLKSVSGTQYLNIEQNYKTKLYHRHHWRQPHHKQDYHRTVNTRDSFIFEHSLLSKTTPTAHWEEHTGIPCKPRLHKLHIS